LHRLMCQCADFKAWKGQFRPTQCSWSVKSLEKRRNRMLCSESVEFLQPGKSKTLWPEKCAGKFRWHVYNVSGVWDSPLECWSVASTIPRTRNPVKWTYPQCFDGTSDAKASVYVHILFWLDKIPYSRAK
jgi:hypothetical protein